MAQRKQNFAARLKSAVRAFPSRAGAWLRSLVRPTEKDKARRRKVRRRFWQLILTVFLVGVISLCIVGSVLVIYVVRNFDAKEYLPEFDKLSMETRSVIFTQNAAGEWEPYQNLLGGNSVWTDLTDIPVDLQNAVIAIEDENFWQHDGVDWMRTVKATVNLALNRLFHIGTTEFGGSTITQQLIKITTQNDDHSIKRKVTEILTAIELEKNESSKQQVLEGYLNNMPMTGNLVGVGIGARYYFGKEVNELSLAECAVLASITNKPAYYDPYAHPEHVRQRQKTILGKMYELGMITRDEYVAAVNEELVFKNGATHQSVQDYYVDLVIEDVIADLMEEKGCTYAYAQNVVFYGGLNIYSAENPALQKRVEAIYADERNFPKHLAADDVTTDPETGAKKGHGDPQTAFFCIDNTGRVIATIGGRGQKEANRVLNRSTQSVRSPGSSIKPLSAYGPSIILNKVHYSSLVHDAPIIVGGKKWPHNYQKTTTPDNGWFTLGYALQESLNTVAVRLVQDLTPQTSFDYVTNTFRISTLVEARGSGGQIMTDIALAPMALGAFTDGVTAREMAAAYGVYSSGGYYNKPYTYIKVTQGEDEDSSTTLLTGGQKSSIAVDPQSCYVMLKLMERVAKYGTARTTGKEWGDWPLFCKTGTSESKKDVYFAGGTPYYVATSWFGYDDNKNLTGNQIYYSRTLWSKAMKALHRDLQIKELERPSGVSSYLYCEKTGMLATEACPKTDMGTYKNDFMPGYCTEHVGRPIGENGERTTDPAPTGTTTAGTTGGTTADTTGTTGTTGATGTTESTAADTTATTGTTAAGEAQP